MNLSEKLKAKADAYRAEPTVLEQADHPEHISPGKAIPQDQPAPSNKIAAIQANLAVIKKLQEQANKARASVMGVSADTSVSDTQSVLGGERVDTAVEAPTLQFCSYCGAGIGEHRRIGEGTCPKCDPPINDKLSIVDKLRAKANLAREDVPQQQAVPILPPKPAAVLSITDMIRQKAEAAVQAEDNENRIIESSIIKYIENQDTPADMIARVKSAEVEIDTAFEPEDEGPETFGLDLLDLYGNPITLNDKQAQGVDFAVSGQNFVLTGEAGTGKSTAIKAVCKSLLRHHQDKWHNIDYRAMDRSGSRVAGPSIAIVSYTRKAVANVQRITSTDFELSAEMESCFQTVHNLLEYSPQIVWSEIQEREVQMFKPQRGEWNPLDVTHLIIEEASMLGLDLWAELKAALKPGVQIIYVGDINQLPPVFGKSVMSYALTKLPIVHLDVVYRQALDNPIIEAAHNVLHGTDIREKKPAFKWLQGKKKVVQPQETMARAMGILFQNGLENTTRIKKWRDEREAWNNLNALEKQGKESPKTHAEIEALENEHIAYDPEQDIVLIPFNKNAMGTKAINYRIAQHLGEQRGAEVFEVVSGFEKHYLAVGDKVFCHKMEGTIIRIVANMSYMGRKAMKPSTDLSRFGFYTGQKAEDVAAILNGDEDFDYSHLDVDILATIEENEERSQASSHLVDVELETGQIITLTSSGDFNGQIFQLGYALSVHKSQGSEWRRVFILFHKAHATMLSRELLYTAMTRAREELIIVARPELISKAIKSPRIKGNSLAEKIEYFNSGYLDEDIEVTV